MLYSTTRLILLILVIISIVVIYIRWKYTTGKEMMSRNTDWDEQSTINSKLNEEPSYERSSLDNMPCILKPLFRCLGFNDSDLKYRSFERIGEKFYYIEGIEKLDWYEALLKCDNMQSRLVSLENKEEWSAIRARLQVSENYWVDISNILSDGSFVNEASGLKARYINFNLEDTNNLSYSERCIELQGSYNHYMIPVGCLDQNYFICEIDNKSYN